VGNHSAYVKATGGSGDTAHKFLKGEELNRSGFNAYQERGPDEILQFKENVQEIASINSGKGNCLAFSNI